MIENINKELYVQMCLNGSYLVVQHNSLITGKQSLSLNSAKILRATIMQIVKEDEDLKPYALTTPELVELLHITKDNIYRVMDNVSSELLSSTLEARVNGKNRKFKKINWVSFCEYDEEINKFVIKLNSDLREFLIGLRNNYTQYTLDNILAMRSIYGVRMFELLQEKIKSKNKNINKDIEFSMKYLRECLNCENKYIRFSQFKTRVLDRAVEEINRVTLYNVTYDCIKQGKVITTILFHMCYKFY